MQHARNANALGGFEIEDDVAALFHPAQACPNMVTGATKFRVSRQHLPAIFDVRHIAVGLLLAPPLLRIFGDEEKVTLRSLTICRT